MKLISASIENERLNIAPSKLRIVSDIDELNVLGEILDIELAENADCNYIHITANEDLVAKINFINKFGDKTNFQINVKKVIEANND